jgi:toxin-antitoxin system PIN domain toxin
VILLDANILLYAFSATSPFHAVSAAWLEDAMARGLQLRLSWAVIAAFLRLITSQKPLEQPASLAVACSTIEELLSYSNVAVAEPTLSHWTIFKKVLLESQAHRNLVNDAHLAALAIEHGASICTNDKDFTRFAGLKIINPVAKH